MQGVNGQDVTHLCYARGVRIPVWFALTVAVFVMLFGAYRIRLGLTMSADQQAEARKRRGRYAMGKRFHLFIGAVYILMGIGLAAMAVGWHPLGGSIGPTTAKPSKDKAPSTNVPIDHLPTRN